MTRAEIEAYRGVYITPIKTGFGVRAPLAEKVVEAIAVTRADTVVPHGAAAANSLGLKTQVPTKLVYLTSGENRTFKLGAQIVEIRWAPQWMLLPSHRAAGVAVRALAWVGKRHAAKALATLKRKLARSTIDELIALRSALPGWLSKSIGQMLVTHG